MPQGPKGKRPHSKDLRKGRRSISNQVYLITTTTARREPFFADWRSGRLVVATLRSEGRARTLSFVVMPDHLHWLMELGEGADLSGVVQGLKSVSSRRINASLGSRGSVWQPGFHDHALRSEEDLVGVARYVVANPVRAGLVRSVREYPLWDAIWI
jgi:REP element-mobilizing transposase RayT